MGSASRCSPSLALAATLASGCSFLFMDRPPDTPARSCTDSVAAPTIDAVFGLLTTVGSVAAIAAGSGFSGEDEGLGSFIRGVGFATLGVGLVFDASAVIGFSWGARCQREHER